MGPIFDCSLRNLDERYEDNLRLIFNQWPKFYLDLNMKAEIQILILF